MKRTVRSECRRDRRYLAVAPIVAGLTIVVSITAGAQVTTRASVDSSGLQGNRASGGGRLSGDGRFVAFSSHADNLVPNDANSSEDVFLHDLATGVTTRVSVDSAGIAGNFGSLDADISHDGRYVAFSSHATNLVPGDTNGVEDVFVHDRATGRTSRVSVGSSGVEGDRHSFGASLSADGRFVAFQSVSGGLVAGDTNDASDVFVHDCATGLTARVSVSSGGAEADSASRAPSLSADGRFVAFDSFAGNLVPGGPAGHRGDVFVHDRLTGATTRVSESAPGVRADGANGRPSLSGDGRFVAFESDAPDLVAGDVNGWQDIFVHDRSTGGTSIVSVNSAGAPANGGSLFAEISGDGGRFVCFVSFASNLVPGDTNGSTDIFVHDRASGQTTRVNVNSSGAEVIGGVILHCAISPNGRRAAFWSYATGLVPGDTNGTGDVFVRDLRDSLAAREGTVNSGVSLVVDVLLVNGSAGDGNRVVTAAVSSPIQLALAAPPAGPGGPGQPLARYALWVWPFEPSQPMDFVARRTVIGTLVNPTQFRPLAAPQPSACLSGTGLSAPACFGVPSPPAPSRAPWLLLRAAGSSRPATFTIQGVIEDDGAGNPTGFSTTNAVVLRVE